MGSAVSSVFGGGGSGGILGAVGGIVGGIFGGPIGSMIGQAIGNMLNDAIGKGANQAIDNLVRNQGMPKFLGEEVKTKITEALNALQKDVPGDAASAAKNQFGPAIKQFEQNFTAELEQAVTKFIAQRSSGADKVASGGKISAGGWLQAIAAGMGEALGNKAAQMVELSEKMTELSKDSANINAELKTAKDDKTKQALNSDAAQNAKDFNMTMTKFQATSQEYSTLNNIFSTAIKALGEALSSMARKQ